MNKLSVVCPDVDPGSPLAILRFHPLSNLIDGINAAGDRCVGSSEAPRTLYDYGFGWGPKKKAVCLTWARRFVCLEMGFLGHRFDNNYLGFDELNGKGVWPVIDGKEELWIDDMRPMKKVEKIRRVLVFGQMPKDASLSDLGGPNGSNYIIWLGRLIRGFREAGIETRFRHHPKLEQKLQVGTQAADGPMEEEVEWADLCVAFSSNALTEAFMLGCPVMPYSQTAMTWRVRSSFEEIRRVSHDERVDWLKWVASSQWSQEQLKSGEAWRALRDIRFR